MKDKLVETLKDRVSALTESQQLMVLYLLIGSNPEDVTRELDRAERAWSAGDDQDGPAGPVYGTGNTRQR